MKNFLLFFVIFLSINTKAATGNQYISLYVKTFDAANLKTRILSITHKNQGHWHTYWKNPGDSGLPIKHLFFSQNQPIKLEALEWPAPQKIISEGDIHTYGYEGEYTLFYKLPKELDQLDLKSKILICDNICIPASFSANINLEEDNLIGEHPFRVKQSILEKRLQDLPKENLDYPIEFLLVKSEKENQFELHSFIRDQEIELEATKENLIFPLPAQPLNWVHEEVQKRNNIHHSTIQTEWDGEFMEPEIPFPSTNKFNTPIDAKFLVKTPKGYIIAKKSFTSFANSLPVEVFDNQSNESNQQSLWLLLLFALFGGFILNFMPCVLPVISLKVFKLLEQAEESPEKVRKHNLFYSIGVIASLILLAVIVHLLKSGGENIGWGFQLQSPLFVLILSYLIFIMSLNLFGLFEFKTPFSSKIGSAEIKDNYWGDVFSGVLTTVLSTPCSAPFLGGAVGFAFTSSPINIYLIFLFIGLGLALPFILSSIFPKALSFLPKPGNWMNTLKYFLGFAMLATFVWLYDIFASLVDFSSFGVLFNFSLVLLFISIFFYSKLQSKFKILYFILPLTMMTYLISIKALAPQDSSALINTAKNSNWKPWSLSKLEESKKQKKIVFMDFTAKWCLTCKVNKKLVLDTDGFLSLAKSKNIELLRADWTHRDERITNWLNKYNLAGVPAYFIQKKNGEIIFLGETLSLKEIKESLP